MNEGGSSEEGLYAKLRRQGVAQACPQCRGEVPLGLDGLFDLAFRAYLRIRGMATRGEVCGEDVEASRERKRKSAVESWGR